MSATFSHTHSHTVQTHTGAHIEETADQTLSSALPRHQNPIAVNKRGQCEGGGEAEKETEGEKKRGSGGSVWERRQMGQWDGENNDEIERETWRREGELSLKFELLCSLGHSNTEAIKLLQAEYNS